MRVPVCVSVCLFVCVCAAMVVLRKWSVNAERLLSAVGTEAVELVGGCWRGRGMRGWVAVAVGGCWGDFGTGMNLRPLVGLIRGEGLVNKEGRSGEVKMRLLRLAQCPAVTHAY